MEELEKNETSTQAEENTVSLASAQALADALAKIEAYTPTTWVDNSSPDIDAEHLNKPEQAIKRVTDALNSAVDAIKDLQSQVTKNAGAISDVNNNLSNAGIPTVKKITDLYAIKKSGFYYYDAGATNAPMSSRGGMIVANYLSDSWISLTVVPYASSKIYTNTKYNNTWVGWAESATKDDLTKSIDFRGNAKTFKVRSGETGLKNIYLDIGDEAGNSCSLGFFSDKENSIRLILNNQVVWTK
nr:MAG TPA: putative tail fiber protein [Bacteriophage sp.]